MRDFHRILLSSEVRELNEEVAGLFEDLERTRTGSAAPHGHCTPPLDVVHHDSSVEVVADLAGVTADRVRVLIKNGVLVLVGEKASPYAGERVDASTFHLVERGFGRFARAVRLDGAVRCRATRAILRGGELRIIVPKIPERRGQRSASPSTDRMRHPLHRRHRRQARAARSCGAACRRSSSATRSISSSPTSRIPPPASASPRDIGDTILELRRRRDDVGQSRLGQEGSARLHRRRAEAAAAGQLPGRRARARQLPRRARARASRSASST